MGMDLELYDAMVEVDALTPACPPIANAYRSSFETTVSFHEALAMKTAERAKILAQDRACKGGELIGDNLFWEMNSRYHVSGPRIKVGRATYQALLSSRTLGSDITVMAYLKAIYPDIRILRATLPVNNRSGHVQQFDKRANREQQASAFLRLRVGGESVDDSTDDCDDGRGVDD